MLSCTMVRHLVLASVSVIGNQEIVTFGNRATIELKLACEL